MDNETIESLLHRLNIDDSIDAFKQQDIDLDLLLEISEDDLKETLQDTKLKLTIGKQKKIILEIKKLKSRKGIGMESCGSLFRSENDDARKNIESWKDKEIRMVLIGKTGSGKSATGNTILGTKHLCRLCQRNLLQVNVHRHLQSVLATRFSSLIPLDDLDEEGRTLDDHIENVPPTLQTFIEKCGRRVIAFNNRLKGDEDDYQVRELLSMINENVEKNNGECYKNEMYEEAEKHLKKREAEIRKMAQMERDKELQAIQKSFDEKLLKEAEKHKTKTKEEFKQWQEEYKKKQEEEKKAKEEQSLKKYDEKVENARDVVREEVVEENSILDKLRACAKLVLPGFFTSYL